MLHYGGFCINRRMILKNGWFDERFRGGGFEDIDWQVRISESHLQMFVDISEDFKLVDHDDLTFDLERLQGYWSLVYFGYSHCPDLCPMALSQLGQMSKNFQNKGGVSVQYIFVSVDPDRDTVDKLKSYVEFFSPDLLGVTGSTEQLEKLSSQLAIGFEVHPKTDANYLVDHSNTILFVGERERESGT